MKYALVLALCVGISAHAQGFSNNMDDGTCYSWNGGNFSAGSFFKCNPPLRAAQPKVVAVAPLPPPVVQSPIMMPMSTPVPHKPIIKKKPKPRPKLICRPA